MTSVPRHLLALSPDALIPDTLTLTARCTCHKLLWNAHHGHTTRTTVKCCVSESQMYIVRHYLGTYSIPLDTSLDAYITPWISYPTLLGLC